MLNVKVSTAVPATGTAMPAKNITGKTDPAPTAVKTEEKRSPQHKTMKKLFKNLLLALCVFFCPVFLHARGAAENEALTIYGLRGPSGVGIIQLFESPPEISGFEVTVEALAQSNLVAARFISGEAKVGILPPDVAAKIASSGRDIRAAAVIGTGMLNLLGSDPSVRSLDDLKGKTVEVAGQGATPDYVFRRILTRRGIDPDRDLTLGYALAYPEIAQSLIAGRISFALLPEPFATMARLGRPELRQIADIQEEWIKAEGSGNYPLTLLVVDGAFASANPRAVSAILDAVRNSIEWVKANPAEAGALVEKHELGIRAPVVAAAVPRSNYVFIPAAAARSSLEALFRVFLDNAPASIGGALPGDSFYLK
jgi:NitT/TauT family transport system substrate-binding protein